MSLVLPKRYQYVKHLGSGGFGDVHQYYDSFLERNVAIKQIKKGTSPAPISLEVSFIKKVVSKHVVSMYDMLEDHEDILLIQECLLGKELCVQKGNINNDELVVLGFQITTGLMDIHKQKICHRDIKLENMRFDDENILKIFDFGISRSGTPHTTYNGNATLAYAAPELFGLQNGNGAVSLTLAFDIYSFAVSFWELATGNLLNFNPYIPNHVKNPSFKSLNLSFSSDLCIILDKCLDPIPTNRPTSKALSETFHRELQYNKHQAKIVYGEHIHNLNSKNRGATITIEASKMDVHYSGNEFLVTNVVGNIYCNNKMISNNFTLPPACVLSFKDKIPPAFVSFSYSHPEIVL
jgi:serine/threonine protein kinase